MLINKPCLSIHNQQKELYSGFAFVSNSKLVVMGFFDEFTKELPMEYAVEFDRLIEMEGPVGKIIENHDYKIICCPKNFINGLVNHFKLLFFVNQ